MFNDGGYREILASHRLTRVLVCSSNPLRELTGLPLEKPVTESKKLALLRDKLIKRRREIVENLQSSSFNQDTGDDLARIQSTIDAVAKAIADEQYAEFHP